MAKAKAAVPQQEEPLSSLSVDELKARLHEAQEGRYRLQFRHASNPLKNPMELRIKRREVARLLTWLNKKNKEAAV